MHSALKHEGKPLYDYARAGVEIEREPRSVTIHSIAVMAGEGDLWTIDVACSKGTYIRTLAEDIGEALGCGAHLAALRRTGSGGLDDRRRALDRSAGGAVAGRARRRAAAGRRADRRLAEGRAPRRGRGPLPRRRAPPPAAGRRAERARLRPGRAPFSAAPTIAGGELIAGRLLSPVEVGAAFPAPGATRRRIEESESLPS